MSNSLVPPLFPEQPDFQYVWKQSENYDPVNERKIQSLSASMDVDEDIVRQNLPDYEALFASQQLYNDTVARSYPTFYRNLASTPFVAVARDDMGNVIETEGWWNEIANAYGVARDTVAIGNIGTRAMLEGRDLYPYERRKIERARQLQRAHMQSEPGFFAAAAELAGTMQETLGYSLAAGYTAGAVSGPAAPVVAPIAAGVTAFATSFNLEAGNLYADLITDGYTPAQAAEIATKYGAAIAGFESVGLKLAGQPIKELGRELIKKRGRDLLLREKAGEITGRILRDYAVGIAGEATTEGVQEMISELGKARASQIYRPDNLYEPEYYETFKQAFVHTAKGMVVMGGVPSAIRLANDSIRTANANHDYQKAKEAAEIRGRSKAPEAQRQVDAEAGETTTLNSSHYIRAQDFKSAITEMAEKSDVTEQQVRDTVEANSPGLMAKIDEAAERDGEVELTKTEYEDAFANTKFRETALLHTAFEENGLTRRETLESDLIRDKMLKERGEEAAKELQDLDEFERQLREVRRDVTQELGKALKGTDAELTMNAAANASLLIGFIRRSALQMNISPKEFVEKHLPQIVQQRLTGQQRGEGFQAGFGPRIEQVTQFSQDDTFQQDWKDQYGRDVENDEYVYHVTTPERAQAILESGELSPGQQQSMDEGFYKGYSAGKVFLAEKSGVDFWASTVREHLQAQQDEEVGDLVVLRVPWDAVKDQMENDEVGERDSKAGSYFSTKPIQITGPETLESGTFDQDADYTFTEGEYRPEVVAWAKEQFGDRVAPNGKPVYQNFVRWFGDSKVVGEDGKPLVVYHGSPRPFEGTKFTADADRANRPSSKMEGFYFSPSFTTANMFAEDRGAGASTMPVYLKASNPFISGKYFAETYGGTSVETRLLKAMRAELIRANPTVDPETDSGWFDRKIEEFVNKGYAFAPNDFGKDGGKAMQRILQAAGFDAAIDPGAFRSEFGLKNMATFGEIIVFDSNQIKSTQNQGDFSADPRILYSKEGPAPRKKMRVDTLLRLATGKQVENVKEAYELLGKGMRPGGKFGPEFSQGVRSLLSGQIAFDEVYMDVLADAPNEALKIAFERQGLDPDLVDLDAAMFDPSKEGPKESTIEAVQEQLSQEFNEYETAKFLLSVAQTLDELAPKEGGYSRANQVLDSIAGVFGEGYDTALEGDTVLLYSKEGDKKVLGTASFEGTDAIKKILLDPNAKPTTLMHELMHWNLELMATIGLDIETKVAQAGYEATVQEAQMLGDIQRLLEWSGFKGTLTEWRGMTIDQRREYHEAIAVRFEEYLYSGVAPSRELRGIFRRLLDYIRNSFNELVLGFQRDYEREFGRKLPGLNDEVRAIFGRMMSAERDVQAFFDQSELDAMLMTREEWVKAGREASEYDEYEQEFKDSMYESKAELTHRRMKEVGTFTRAYELVARKQRRELNRIRAQIRKEVEEQVRLEAVYQFRTWVKTGKYQTAEGEFTPEPMETRKLSREMVEQVAPDLVDALSRRGLLRQGGLPLDVVRDMFEFEDNRAMLQALADSRNPADEITHRTDQRLLNEHTDLMDPVVQQENIHAAVHNKIREKVMARELKFLLNNGRASGVMMKAMADAAKQIINSTPTGDIDIAAYSRAAARARKKAIKALKDGDMEAAQFAKRQEVLNEALIREGMKAREEVRKLVNTNKRVFKRRTDKAIAEAGYDVTVVKAIRALMVRLGIGRADFDPAEALARFRQEDPEFYEEVRPDLEYFLGLPISQPRVGDRRKPMEHLTLQDVRTLRGLADRMMKRAKDKRKATIDGKKEDINKLRQEAQDTLEANVEVKRKPDDKSIFGKIRDYFSDVIRFEHLFRRADGGKVGPWTRMFRQVKDAANKYREELRQFLSGDGFDFEGKLRSLDLKIPGGERTLTMDLPSANRTVKIGENGRHAKTELIHLAMHYYGNSSNRKRLVEGYAGREASEETMQQVDAEIRRFLEQQIQQGILTRKDFEFMQSVFDHFSGEDMLGRAQKVMKNLRGYEMNEVKAEEFPIQFPGDAEATVFGGGYIPVRFKETVQNEEQGQGVLEEDASLEQQASRMVNILPGFTKDRVKGEVGLELYLGLSHLANHAAEVYRFINMAEPIDSVSRVLKGRDLAAAFKARFGNKAYRHLEGWMKRSAFQRFDRGEESQVASMMLRMSRNANMSVMFLNIGNTLQNYAGLLIPMRRVGKRRIISALMNSTFNRKIAAEVASKSPEMKARLERQIFDIYNTQNRILTSEDSVWARLQGWADKYAYVLQQITQNHVDVAVWQAAYNQETEAALRENVSAEEAEARAIAHADSIVRQSQMAGEKEDISAFESGGPISRAMFPFKSWFINWFNNAATQGRLDMKVEDRSRVAAVASTYLYMLMIPAMLAQAAVELARGDDWDDEDDGYGDDMTELFLRSQFDQVTGALPLVSDISRLAVNNWFDDKYWNNRYPVAPWIRAWERIVSAPVRKDAVDAGLDMATQTANLMGVPAVGVWNRVSLIGDEIAGELESESTYDLIRGAVTGQRSDLQRLSQ